MVFFIEGFPKNIQKINILSQKFSIIQKIQLPNISGQSNVSIISNVLDVSSIKCVKISEIFWIFDKEVLGKEMF